MAAISLFLLVTGINYGLCKCIFDLSSMSLGKWILYFVSSFMGTMFVVFLSQLMPEIKMLKSLGKNSMYYYGLHYEALGALKMFSVFSKVKILMVLLVFAMLFPVVTAYQKLKRSIKWGGTSD